LTKTSEGSDHSRFAQTVAVAVPELPVVAVTPTEKFSNQELSFQLKNNRIKNYHPN
jgi:hypothetical protein